MTSFNLPIKDKSKEGKLIQISRFRKNTRKTAAHKHNGYFEMIYLSGGSGYHTIDSVKYAVSPPVIFFVRKEQVHHWELDAEADGYVLMMKKGFIDKSLDNDLKHLLAEVSSQPILSVKDNTNIDSLFLLLSEEEESQNEYIFHIIEGLLKALLAKVLLVSKPVMGKRKINRGIYESFQELLSENTSLKRRVAYYASKLNTTPQNLNAACRKAVNESAAEILSNVLISEAKRLLLYTDKTVSEISFALDFNDPSHFVKYFKKVTGLTPGRFRLGT